MLEILLMKIIIKTTSIYEVVRLLLKMKQKKLLVYMYNWKCVKKKKI